MMIILIYPLVICYSLLLKMAIEIVDLPIDSMVVFHCYVNVYQRVKYNTVHKMFSKAISHHIHHLSTITIIIFWTHPNSVPNIVE